MYYNELGCWPFSSVAGAINNSTAPSTAICIQRLQSQWNEAPFPFSSFMYIYHGATLGLYFNPNWHELRKPEKCSSLEPPRSKFYKTQWAWQGVKLTRLMSIFTSKKVKKFLLQIQLTKLKSNPKITRGVKLPCLMPIRVKRRNKNDFGFNGTKTAPTSINQ